MLMTFSPLRRMAAPAAAGLLMAGVAACTSYTASEPYPVAAENPSITYQYDTEEELLAASQRAQAYCSQYQSTPYAETTSLSPDTNGGNTVVFECVRTPTSAQSAMVPSTPTTSGLSYSYRSDQDLLIAARNAEDYCERSGRGTRVTHDIVTNADGTKTVTFQCAPR